MADKKSNEPRRENGRIPTYQTAYHGAKKKDPLTNLARIIVEKFDKRRVPENTIDTIPFDQIYPDGLCRIGDNFYSKMVQFYDINYQLAQNDEKQHIFAEYCQFLNYFDETIHFQFCFINQRVDMEEYKKVISIPDQDDEFNVVRREYATYLRNQLEKGNNGIVKSKYLVFGIEARDRKQAVSRLAKIESDVINKFKLLGCKCVPVNGLERLRIMHDYLNQDSLEKFAMKSFKDVVESGLTPKNFITPTSFDFRAKDYYKIGDMFATTNFLVISAPEISDEMLADILNMEDALSVTMHIDTLNQTEAMKYIKGKLSDINKMKIEEQKKAIRSGYDMDIIPPDIETYSEEAHGLLKEMQSRNERLFKVTFLITSFNENLQKMKDFRFTLSNNIQSANCALRKLDHQQEQGLISSLPLGKNFIKQKRYLTTSSTAVFVPFTTQELFMDSKESLYMGLNSLSNGMIMADRKLLKNPNGLILGTPGSGKSFATKREILNTFLVTTDDILICDPEAEYYPLVNYLGGQVIKIGQSSKHYINPLDINLNYSDDDDPVSLKADFILSFMELVVGGKTGLKPEEKSAIDFAVSRIYTKYFENPVPENMPILQDLYNELLSHKEDLVSQHIAQCMYLYVEGSNNLFNHHTNVDLDNRIICFDIKSLGKTLKKLGMLVVQDAVWNRVTVNREMHKFTRFYIDELSKDDGTDNESASIATQKSILTDYVKKQGWHLAKTYVDDGYSGTNFQRPSFQNMIKDIENGLINCVITKDLSRLGRNYLDCGLYLEVFFPEHNVRYIAVNDGVDTLNKSAMDITPFRNILNEMYSADVSVKIKSAYRARFQQGKFMGTTAPYGYVKDPADHNHLLIDDKVAHVVREIFDLALAGNGIAKIRKHINKQHILRPAAYAVEQGSTGYERHFEGNEENRYIWSENSVRGILRSPIYAGNLAGYKRIAANMKSKKRPSKLPEEWEVIPDTHEGIVTQEEFDTVQQLITSRRLPENKGGFENIFAGVIKCADCGYAMRAMSANRRKRPDIIDCVQYSCNNYGRYGNIMCTAHSIEARDLFNAVLTDINRFADMAVNDEKAVRAIEKRLTETDHSRAKALEKEQRKLNKRLAELDRLFSSLYEDKVMERITERNFEMMSGKYQKEQLEIEARLKEVMETLNDSYEKSQGVRDFLSLIRNYQGIKELDASL